MSAPTDYPPPPWHLRGQAWLNIQLIPIDRIQHLVPPAARIVAVLPGRTLGGIYLARYGPGSTLEYSELIVFCGLARRGWRLGGWVSHIYVDSPRSVAGGRAIWGLPKQLAIFDWSDDCIVRAHGLTVARATGASARGGLPIVGLMPAFGVLAGRPVHFTGRMAGAARISPTAFEIPPESPFASFGAGRGWSFSIDRLDARIPAPR